MSTIITTPERRSSRTREKPRWSFGNVVASEFLKLLTLRSTFTIAAVMIVVSVGFTALVASTYGDITGGATAGQAAYASSIASSASFAQLVIGVLSVLIVSTEYSTNMAQSTFAASPRRWAVLAAKMTVAGAVTIVLSLVSSILGYLATALVLDNQGSQVALGDAEVLGAIGGTAFYLIVVALFSTAVASLLRHSAAGIAAMAGVFFVVAIVFQAVAFGDFHPGDYFLGSAAQAVSGAFWRDDVPGVGRSAVIVAIWLVVPAVMAFLFLKKRDA